MDNPCITLLEAPFHDILVFFVVVVVQMALSSDTLVGHS